MKLEAKEQQIEVNKQLFQKITEESEEYMRENLAKQFQSQMKEQSETSQRVIQEYKSQMLDKEAMEAKLHNLLKQREGEQILELQQQRKEFMVSLQEKEEALQETLKKQFNQ